MGILFILQNYQFLPKPSKKTTIFFTTTKTAQLAVFLPFTPACVLIHKPKLQFVYNLCTDFPWKINEYALHLQTVHY